MVENAAFKMNWGKLPNHFVWPAGRWLAYANITGNAMELSFMIHMHIDRKFVMTRVRAERVMSKNTSHIARGLISESSESDSRRKFIHSFDQSSLVVIVSVQAQTPEASLEKLLRVKVLGIGNVGAARW
jgi:hypothetical protein